MIDLAFDLLKEKINSEVSANSLWVVDENITESQINQVIPRSNLLAITNRIDICETLRVRGIEAQASDFDFSTVNNTDRIYFRISKEKAIVHHVINCSKKKLNAGGVLTLCGYKNEGIKTYLKKTALLFNDQPIKSKGGKTSELGEFTRQLATANRPEPEQSLDGNYAGLEDGSLGGFLNDKNYQSFTELEESPNLVSKPGVFGWNKVDKGSAFLIENFELFLDQLDAKPESIVDLGCGYGFLSVMANEILPVNYFATDNNVAAVACCKENFEKNNIQGEVLLDDCGSSINRKFDVVVCNPPFHKGFDIEGKLTERFLQTAKRLMNKKGVAFFVVNSFIPLEKKSQVVFSNVSVLANNGKFKLLVLS